MSILAMRRDMADNGCQRHQPPRRAGQFHVTYSCQQQVTATWSRWRNWRVADVAQDEIRKVMSANISYACCKVTFIFGGHWHTGCARKEKVPFYKRSCLCNQDGCRGLVWKESLASQVSARPGILITLKIFGKLCRWCLVHHQCGLPNQC